MRGKRFDTIANPPSKLLVETQLARIAESIQCLELLCYVATEEWSTETVVLCHRSVLAELISRIANRLPEDRSDDMLRPQASLLLLVLLLELLLWWWWLGPFLLNSFPLLLRLFLLLLLLRWLL